MSRRIKLHEEFCEILGSNNAYFQPPAKLLMSYPCIRYSLSIPDQVYANNRHYKGIKQYEGMIIDSDPESALPDKLRDHFEMISFGKPYVADNLNHFPFTLYY